MPLRSPKMYLAILGFHRLVWWPKWTPASSSSFIVIWDIPPPRLGFCFRAPGRPPSPSTGGGAGPPPGAPPGLAPSSLHVDDERRPLAVPDLHDGQPLRDRVERRLEDPQPPGSPGGRPVLGPAVA